MGIIRLYRVINLINLSKIKRLLLKEDFIDDEILIFREAKENTETVSTPFISTDIDPTLTDELIQEGIAREVINRIQNKKGFKLSLRRYRYPLADRKKS